ncbi:MAG: hemerythrin domain-containing protein [Alcaligenaceae bacterium]|nr:hemerythrin domain-containing protein [Alcaligenaceae bacterium]
MDIQRFKHQHVDILQRIDALRKLAHGGIQTNSHTIAQQVQDLGKVVNLHLAIEDRILYPAVRKTADARIAAMGQAYQEEMKGIANRYIRFTNTWSDPARVAAEPDAFRDAANTVLKMVYQRMQRENREFYPAIENI